MAIRAGPKGRKSGRDNCKVTNVVLHRRQGLYRTIAEGEEAIAMTKGPDNNGLERTRRVGVPAARAVVRVSPCRSTQCSTYPRGDRLTRRPSESAARPREKNFPNRVLGSPTMAPGSPIVRGSAVSSTNKAPNSWERSPATKAGSRDTRGREHARVAGPNIGTQNNALERTRRGGVPAARAVVRVSPCRSTRCYTGAVVARTLV